MDVLFGIQLTPGEYSLVCQRVIKDYNVIVAAQPKQKRGCEHSLAQTKFCGQCGKPTWVDNSEATPLSQKDIDESCILEFIDPYGFSWAYDCDRDSPWYVGYQLDQLDKSKSLHVIQQDLTDSLLQTFNFLVMSQDIDFCYIYEDGERS